jgi:predicted ATPase
VENTMGEIAERFEAGFRLRSLTIHEHRILGTIHLDFCKKESVSQGVYTSVIIGANGIGKSYLLRSIAEIFSCLENLYQGKEPTVPQYYFDIKYFSRWEEMEFANSTESNLTASGRRLYTQFVFKRNNREISVSDMVLPRRVIASATTITDKFIAKSSEIYRYKGLRNENSPSTTGTRTMVRKTVNGLLDSLDEKYGFKKELENLLRHLGLQPRLELSYNMRYVDVFVKRDMTGMELQHIFENQGDVFRRATKLWGTRNFEKIKEEDWEKLNIAASFFSRLAERGFYDGKRQLKYNLLEETYKVSEDREALKILSSLDLLSYPSLTVYKDADNYEFDQSSSGESSLLCQLVSIMSDIEPNSLVLIDEPENSAHPNWQMNYMGWIKNIFEKYYNCHFVISTHSHFILTDLEPSTSDIVALEKKGDVIHDVSEGVNTFNWSVDDILYRVFGVRNTRNRAFEEDIMELYQMMSDGSGDLDKIKGLTLKLSSVVLPGDDPLLEILNQARKYVETR